MNSSSAVPDDAKAFAGGDTVTFLFTDIEGSTRLWEQEPERMRTALAHHDALARTTVAGHRGLIFKMSGDGVYAAFDDPLDALCATLTLQMALIDPAATCGIPLRIRCGLHAGPCERRDGDFFGRSVNRAARIMGAAYGGQVVLSEAVAALIRDRLPDGVGLRDLGRVRLRDLEHPERIHQVEHPRLRRDFPALRSLELTPNNLPQQVNTFIGRERELAQVHELLARTRLLTLVGPGGIGKTRLSLQLAADALDAYPDGAWLVELAAITDPQGVAQAAAAALGVKEERGRPVIEALLKHLENRQLLLVLDNCEHLVQACAELASRLLRAAPKLTLLASSRERLRIAGEQTYPVPALSVPDTDDAAHEASLMRFEAARLFVDRATAARPAFKVDARSAGAIVAICVRLDGIPLALELAAARVRALPVETLAARLDDRFRLLSGGDRTALPRQQTLRALIDWSFDLLTEPERCLLRRLAVFAGGWTLQAGVAIAGDVDPESGDVLELLTRLVEKSLVVLEPATGRYRLLDTVRQYAQERLEDASDGEATRDRHLAFYLSLAEAARPQLSGPDQGDWLTRLDLERENLLAAHAWSGRAGDDGESGLKLASSLRRYWMMRGLPGRGYRMTSEALARADAHRFEAARCQALFDAGQLCGWMGRYVQAQSHLEASLALAHGIGEPRLVARAMQALSMVLLGQGQAGAARRHSEDGVALARQVGTPRELAVALNALAQLDRSQGEFDAAERGYRDVLALARDLGDSESIAIALLNLAMVGISRGDQLHSRRMLTEVSMIVARGGSKPVGQSMLDACAGLAALSGQWARGAEFYGAAQAQAEQTGMQRDPADEKFLAPLMAQAREAIGSDLFCAAHASGSALSYDEATAHASRWLAQIS